MWVAKQQFYRVCLSSFGPTATQHVEMRVGLYVTDLILLADLLDLHVSVCRFERQNEVDKCAKAQMM
jgi:hypothetical protein